MLKSASPFSAKPSGAWMPGRQVIKILLWYLGLNVLWMVSFSWLLRRYVHTWETEDICEGINTCLAVGLTAVFLGLAFHRYLRTIQRSAGELEENEARLRVVGDNLPDSYVYQFVRDAAGRPRFLYLSAGVERVHGLLAANVLRDATVLFDQMDPDQRPAHEAAVAESSRHLSDFRMELRIHRLDGAARIIRVQSRPRRHEDGGLVWDGFVTDVTEQKRAELALQQSEERFRMLVETAPEAIFIRTKGWFSYLNGAALQLFGAKDPEQLLGKPVIDRFAPECRQEVHERMQLLDDAGESTRDAERVLLRLDGTPVNVIISAVPFYYRDRHSVLVFARDITERKRAELALRESERFATNTLDSLSAHIAILDEQGNILAVNRAWRRFWEENTGRLEDGVPGINYLSVCDAAEGLDAATGHAFAAGIRRVLAGQELEFSLEYSCDSPSEPRWFLGRVTRFIGEKPLRLVVEHENITRRKRVENALRLNQSLLSEMGRTAKVGGWDFDPATGEGHWTEEVARIHDLDPALPPNKDIGLSFYHGDSRAKIEAAVTAAVAHGTPYDLELELVSAKGNHRWVHTIGQPVIENGKVTKVYGSFQDVTEFREAKEALQRSEAKWRSYIARAPVGILVADANGRHVEANRAIEEMLGYEPGGLLGTLAQDLPAPENGAALQEHLEELAATGHANGQFLLRRKDGSLIWALVHATKMADGRLLGIFQDMTEHKQAEAALRDSEAQFRAMFETASVGWVQTDPPTGKLLRANSRMSEITGYATDELLNMTVEELVHPDDWPRDYQSRQRLFSGEAATYHVEKRYIRKDRRPVWVSVNMTVIRDAKGQPFRTVATVEDITERRKAEEERMRLSTALEQAAESIVITDLNGMILYVNPAFERISGYSRREVIGQKPALLRSGKHDAAFYQKLWDTITRGEMWRGHFINKRKDGKLYEEEATVSPVRNASGKIDHYMAIKLDVTREVALENQFRQAQKLEAIGQLAGGVAHDFNNILTSILMEVELGDMEENGPAEIREGLRQIRKDAERAAGLTRQLLLFSRRQVMQSSDLDLNEVVTNLAKMLQRIIGEDVRLQLHLHPTPLLAHADAGMLDQVAVNLAVNARDAMPDGGTLTIETSEKTVDAAHAAAVPDAVPGNYVCLSVSDSGTGIPAAVLPHIFEPFFTTKEAGKGTGLGLATVFGIVKQHRGWLAVTSDVGQGTSFKIYLPALVGQAAVAEPESPTVRRGGSETLLLVEDDEMVRLNLRRILERNGYRVLEAANGDEALAVWAGHAAEIGLLLTDLVMPGSLNGQRLAQHLRKERPELRVIYSSGYSAEIAGREIQLQDGEDFLQKPLKLEQLLKTIRSSLDRQQ